MKDQNIREVLGNGIKFHEELDRIAKEKLIGERFVLRDGKVIDDWDGTWGTSEFALLMVETEDGKQQTTLCGGKAVVNQIRKLTKRGKLPGRIWCFLNKVPSDKGDYFLLDWEPSKDPENPITSPLAKVAIAAGAEPVKAEGQGN